MNLFTFSFIALVLILFILPFYIWARKKKKWWPIYIPTIFLIASYLIVSLPILCEPYNSEYVAVGFIAESHNPNIPNGVLVDQVPIQEYADKQGFFKRYKKNENIWYHCETISEQI